jgi:hypothetical protein
MLNELKNLSNIYYTNEQDTIVLDKKDIYDGHYKEG